AARRALRLARGGGGGRRQAARARVLACGLSPGYALEDDSFPAALVDLAHERGGSLRLRKAHESPSPLERRPGRVFFLGRNPDRIRARHRSPHPTRGIPPPARARARELPARIGRTGTPWPPLARRLGLPAPHLRGGRTLDRAGRRLPRLRLRREARANRAAPVRGSRPAREPLRRSRRARALRSCARRR